MKPAIVVLTLLHAGASFEVRAAAQRALHEGQGHPLKGVWLGDWGPNKTTRNSVVIEIDWDGKAYYRHD
jgi:hypothetical protein